jgi:hypothetical protein
MLSWIKKLFLKLFRSLKVKSLAVVETVKEQPGSIFVFTAGMALNSLILFYTTNALLWTGTAVALGFILTVLFVLAGFSKSLLGKSFRFCAVYGFWLDILCFLAFTIAGLTAGPTHAVMFTLMGLNISTALCGIRLSYHFNKNKEEIENKTTGYTSPKRNRYREYVVDEKTTILDLQPA